MDLLTSNKLPAALMIRSRFGGRWTHAAALLSFSQLAAHQPFLCSSSLSSPEQEISFPIIAEGQCWKSSLGSKPSVREGALLSSDPSVSVQSGVAVS